MEPDQVADQLEQLVVVKKKLDGVIERAETLNTHFQRLRRIVNASLIIFAVVWVGAMLWLLWEKAHGG